MQAIVSFVAENFFWVFIAVLFVNLLQRRHQAEAQRKRFATLYLAIALFLIYTAAQTVVTYDVSAYYFVLAVVAVVAVLYRYRAHTFPFRLRCRRTGKILNMETILFRDSNILPEAENGAPEPQEAPEPEGTPKPETDPETDEDDTEDGRGES